MKKFLKYLQTHYLLFSFFTLYLVIPLILVLAGFLCAHSLEFVSENIISVISGILAYIGTTVLGMVSVWQNKQAFVVNTRLMHLQRSEFEKNKSSIIRFQKNCELQKNSLSNNESEKNIQNYYVLASNDFDNLNNDVDCLVFYYESIGHELNQIKIPKIKIKYQNNTIYYYQTKHQIKTGFCYDFENQAYKLKILLLSKNSITKNLKNKQFEVSMALELFSKANIQSNMNITFCIDNFDQISISNVFYYYDNDEITPST